MSPVSWQDLYLFPFSPFLPPGSPYPPSGYCCSSPVFTPGGMVFGDVTAAGGYGRLFLARSC